MRLFLALGVVVLCSMTHVYGKSNLYLGYFLKVEIDLGFVLLPV